MQNSAPDVKNYYRQITEVDIGQVAEELLGPRIIEKSERLWQCDCPNHQSQSKRSLHIMLDKQAWYCFGCAKGGDVLQLVEFIQSGHATTGQSGEMPDSHRKARDYLAAKAGLPPLSSYGLSRDGLVKTESDAAFEFRVKAALTALATFYHQRLRSNPEALAWLKSHYAISDELIDRLLIGYADNEANASDQGIITTLKQDFSPRVLAATGAFSPTSNDGLFPFFKNRIVFPYWSRGRVAFMIGRSTPWTSDDNWEKGKYKKLPVHDEHARKHIAPFIDNSLLYNEDAFTRLGNTENKTIILTEGVTDCIALMDKGFTAISPVTTRIRKNDVERVARRLKHIDTVYICQDNEVSEAGLKGAFATAGELAKHKITVKIVTLPRPDGLDKIDVNDYFASGHSAEDFQTLLDVSRPPMEFGLDRITENTSEEDRNKILGTLLYEVAELSPLEQERLITAIREKVGKNVSAATLRRQINNAKAARKAEKQQHQRPRRTSSAPPGSCLALVEETIFAQFADKGAPDFSKVAEAAFEWFTHNGAMFFKTRGGHPFMVFENHIYWMDSGIRGEKRLFSAMMYRQTGLLSTTTNGRIFFDTFANLSVIHGEEREDLSWLHTDLANHTLWFNLNNKEHEIAKITPEGVEILQNGANSDKVVLKYSDKIDPIHYDPDVNLSVTDRLFTECLIDNFSCPKPDRYLILSWISCFLLIDYSGTKPMTRFEGSSSSGKTTAAKLITTLIYGSPQQKVATLAANYTDGSKNPLLSLDNIEAMQMTDGLTEFMLTGITGIAREKRKSGTDSENVSEQIKCLINTTGIEPLKGELTEILSRTFTINFDREYQRQDGFLENEVIAELAKHRNKLLSAIMKRTAMVLRMIRDGRRKRVMTALQSKLGDHDKRRCNDFLSLAYLIMLTGETDTNLDKWTEEIHPEFIAQIESLNKTSRETARESNPISAALEALFNAYQVACEMDENTSFEFHNKPSHVDRFTERYLVHFDDEEHLNPLPAGKLLTALNRISGDFGLNWKMKTARQLSSRLRNDLQVIRDAGFEIEWIYNSDRKTYNYNVSQKGCAYEN